MVEQRVVLYRRNHDPPLRKPIRTGRTTDAKSRFISRHDDPAAFDPRAYLKETVIAMKDIAVARYEAFETAGKASKLDVLNLETMTARYLTGELDPKIN